MQLDLPNPPTIRDRSLWRWLALILFCLLVFGTGVAARSSFADESPDALTNNDFRELGMAIEKFKLRYAVYPPSRILLSNDRDDYKGDAGRPDERASLAYIMALWPRLKWNADIDWSGGVKGFKSVKLEGDQCLVYFLNGPRGEGFSTNPANPTSAGGRRAGPFFEFDKKRLVQRVKGNPFASYKDGYGKNVYAYFSSGRTANGYGQDCPSLKVAPYFKKGSDPVRYYNANTFQIISAGKDGIFGPGGAWSPDSAAKDAGPNGRDDLANFHGDLLGK
jgi:hypothetical protein